MYNSHVSTVNGSQKWLYLAISYQTRAEKLSKNFSSPSEYPDSVFACYRGYARCMQMYDACWSHVDAMNASYFRKRYYEEKQIEIQRKKADKEAKTDEQFIRVMFYLVAVLIGILFADVWISFIEWLAPHLI